MPVTLLNKYFCTIYSFCLWIDFFLRGGRGPTLSKKGCYICLPCETNPWLVLAGTCVNSQGFEWNAISLLAGGWLKCYALQIFATIGYTILSLMCNILWNQLGVGYSVGHSVYWIYIFLIWFGQYSMFLFNYWYVENAVQSYLG